MSKAFLIVCLIATVFLGGCGDDVPDIKDPHHPSVDGIQMKPYDFLQKYCNGKVGSETCQKVRNAMSIDSTKGTVNRF